MRIGIDLGGTKIEAIALDVDGRELARLRRSTPDDDYEGAIQAITQIVTKIEGELGATGTVGVGTPGALSPATGLMKNANSVCLNGRPFDRDLAASLGRPVRLANDANCFALSEAVDGAAAGADVVFGVILGTGVGGGVVAHGRILTGPNAIAGEWGHNPLPWPRDDERPGPPCYCGGHGCVETFLSGPALARSHQERTGDDLSSHTIADRAAAGNVAASETLELYEHRLARGLASVINVIDPDVIVLGGGVSNITRLYDNVPALWNKFVFSDRVATRLVRAEYGDSSGVRGAAWLWPKEPATSGE